MVNRGIIDYREYVPSENIHEANFILIICYVCHIGIYLRFRNTLSKQLKYNCLFSAYVLYFDENLIFVHSVPYQFYLFVHQIIYIYICIIIVNMRAYILYYNIPCMYYYYIYSCFLYTLIIAQCTIHNILCTGDSPGIIDRNRVDNNYHMQGNI